jgi:hypothetical protein
MKNCCFVKNGNRDYVNLFLYKQTGNQWFNNRIYSKRRKICIIEFM